MLSTNWGTWELKWLANNITEVVAAVVECVLILVVVVWIFQYMNYQDMHNT